MEEIEMLPDRNRRFYPVDRNKGNPGSGSGAEGMS
jgi:hypothetical protein